MKSKERSCNSVRHPVAPVRERGLKCTRQQRVLNHRQCRSREGAWIEIRMSELTYVLVYSRSREGAWIEICLILVSLFVAPSLP